MKTEQANLRLAGTLVFGAVILWFLFALTMGIRGNYQSGPGRPPLAMGLTQLAAVLGFIILYRNNRSLRDFANALDLRLVIGLHVWRIGAIDFLICQLHGRLPAGFALPAGFGDIITGLAAIPLILAISRNVPATRAKFVAWNIFGLADLVLAVSLGILHAVKPLGIFAGAGPTMLLMSQFPRSMVPTFFVPLFMLLHLLALARRKEVRSREGDATIVAVRESGESQPRAART